MEKVKTITPWICSKGHHNSEENRACIFCRERKNNMDFEEAHLIEIIKLFDRASGEAAQIMGRTIEQFDKLSGGDARKNESRIFDDMFESYDTYRMISAIAHHKLKNTPWSEEGKAIGGKDVER